MFLVPPHRGSVTALVYHGVRLGMVSYIASYFFIEEVYLLFAEVGSRNSDLLANLLGDCHSFL